MTDQATRIVPAGWYEDPASAVHVRWWNGLAWTEHTTLKPTTPPVPTPVVEVAAAQTPAADAAIGSIGAATEVAVASAEHDRNTLEFGYDAATADRIAEVRELERQYGISTAEYGLVPADEAFGAHGDDITDTFRPQWHDDDDEAAARRTVTASSWLIALWPVFTLVAGIAAGYVFVYITTEPSIAGIPVILGVIAVPLLLTIIWAITDARKLRQYGHRPASAAFSLLGPLVYLIARRVRVRGVGPLVSLLLLTVLAFGAPIAAWFTGVATPVVTAIEVQQTVSADLVGSGAVDSVTCPFFIENTAPGTLYTCDAVLADGTNRAVWVSFDTIDGEFSYALSLR